MDEGNGTLLLVDDDKELQEPQTDRSSISLLIDACGTGLSLTPRLEQA